MRRVLICTGVLGGGTALVFAAAVGASALFPNGGTIAATNQIMMMKGGMAVPLGGGVNFGGGFTTGGTTTTIVNADGSTTTISGGPVAVPVPASTNDVAPGATAGP
jgi:hypothetical protein